MILSDKDITVYAEAGMIIPFIPHQVRTSAILGLEPKPRISYGLSSTGYDYRLDTQAGLHLLMRPPIETLEALDPKNFNSQTAVPLRLLHDLQNDQQFWELPGYGYALGLTLETWNIPEGLTGVTLGKSTYARSGLVVNVTPAEAGWRGRLVVEMFNGLPMPVRVYGNEGIAQMQFFQNSSTPSTSYADRDGKYQNQDSITFSKV